MNKDIKRLLSNWMTIITICDLNIEQGRYVEFYEACKQRAINGYKDTDKMLQKEQCSEVIEEYETEEGSYDAEEDERRSIQSEELQLEKLSFSSFMENAFSHLNGK